jgi:hypothetical protein
VSGAAHDGDNLGFRVVAGDFNADGYADVAASATQDYNGRDGEVLAFRGSKHGMKARGSKLFNLTSFPGHDLISSQPALYGSAMVVFRPSHTKFASLAIGGEMYSDGSDYGNGMIDEYVGSRHGLRATHGQRITSPTETQFLGDSLAP